MERLRTRAFLIASCMAALALPGACTEESTDQVEAGPDAGDEEVLPEAANDVVGEEPQDAAQEVAVDASDEGDGMRRACAPFGPSLTSPASSFGESLVIADFDCDSLLDVMTSHYLASPGGLLGGRVDFHAGRGDGTFAEAISIEVRGGPTELVSGDFDGDGVQDLVVAAVSGIRSERSALLLIRGRCGQWPSEAQVLFEPNPYRGADTIVADMNADGADDLIVSRSRQGGRIEALLGGVSPLQTSLESDVLPEGMTQLAMGDLDGDGKREVVAAGEGQWAILGGAGPGALQLARVIEVDATGMVELETMDVESDGTDELVALRSGGSLDAYRYVPVLGRFLHRELMRAEGLKQVVVGDISGDGRKDLAAVTSDATALLINAGEELLRAEIPEAEGRLVIGDVTGDGYNDLVFGSRERLKVYPNQPFSCENRLPRW